MSALPPKADIAEGDRHLLVSSSGTGMAVRLVAVRFRTYLLQKPPHRVELRAKAGPVSGFQVRNCLIVVVERLPRAIRREACERRCHCTARSRRRGAGFHEERRQCLGERLLHYNMLAIGCDHALELWQVSLHRTQIERRYIENRVLDRDHM